MAGLFGQYPKGGKLNESCRKQIFRTLDILNKFIKEQKLVEKDIINIYGTDNCLYCMLFWEKEEIK